jgi:hypothetical protein
MVVPIVAWVTAGSAEPGVSATFGSAGEPSRVRPKVAVALGSAPPEEAATDGLGLDADVSTAAPLAVTEGEANGDPDAPDAVGDCPGALAMAMPTTKRTANPARRYQARRVIAVQAYGISAP